MQVEKQKKEDSVSEVRQLPSIEELALKGSKVAMTENQLKVMANKYLKGDSPEVWLRRIARNIASADMIYEKSFPPETLFENVQSTFLKAEYDTKINMLLLQLPHLTRTQRTQNFRVFQANLLKAAEKNSKALNVLRDTEEKFYTMLSNFDFLPNSPCLMNAGRDLQGLHACFRGDQPIMTFNGIRPIEEIKEGELVLTASGRFRKVVKKMERLVDHYRVINIWKMPKETLAVSDDHPILCLDKKTNTSTWKFASELETSDYVAVSYPKDTKDVEKLSIIDFLDKKKYVVKGEYIYKINKDKNHPKYSIQMKLIPAEVTVDHDLMKLFGYYLSEGDIDQNDSIRFTFNSEELDYINEVILLMQKKFSITSKIKKSNSGNWSNLRFFSRIVVQVFRSLMGEGFNKKNIPAWILELPVEKQKGLLIGIIRGDGFPIKNRHTTNIRATLANANLVYGLWVIFARLGFLASFRKDEFNKLSTTNPYTTVLNSSHSENIFNEIFIDKQFNKITQMSMLRVKEKYVDGRFFLPVKDIEIFMEPIKVFNIEVEEDHTYVANNIAVHNCFVLPVGDSIEEIYHSLTAMALIHQSGGGTGFSFSSLRPEGDPVQSTKGVASGPMSFMRIFDTSTDVVKQGGQRRGANMGIMSYKHPDIKKFITSKSADKGFLQNFNISVALDEEFMHAVINDSEIDLVNPKSKKIVAREKAKDMFDLMAKCAWETGDPGFVVIDRINSTNSNPTPAIGQIESTNPCVAGDTLVSTEKGLMRMENLVTNYSNGGLSILTDNRVPLEIKNNEGTISLMQQENISGVCLDIISRAFTTGVKEVFKIETSCGLELEATADHKLLTKNGWVAVKDLNLEKDNIFIQQSEGFFNKNTQLPFVVENNFVGLNGKKSTLQLPHEWSKELGQILGWLIGDGWLRTGDKDCRIGFTFGKSDDEVLHYLKPILNKFYGQEIKDVKMERNTRHLSYHSQYFVDFFQKLGVKAVDAQYKTVPESLFTAPKEAVIGFLQGLFTADGTVNFNKEHSTSYIRLTSTSKKLLKEVQLLLLNLGITSNIFDRSRAYREGLFEYTNKDGETVTYDSEGICFELSMTRDSIKFIEKIGFLCDKNKEKLNNFYTKKFYAAEFSTGIISITPLGTKKVYDLTEPRTLSFITNGLLSLDCGEQPLLPWEPCTLGSINLSHHVKEVEGKYVVNYTQLEQTTKLATHFLDNVIDMGNYPLPEIEQMSKGNRRIGLGVMGWAEMLVSLEIPYDSEEAITLGEEIMSFINTKSLNYSEELAEKRGAFYHYKDSIYDKNSSYFRGKEHYPRNCARTTIAPTGTIAITAGLQGSGIEPFFAIAYKRYQAEAVDALKKGEAPPEQYTYYEVIPTFLSLAERHNWFGLDKNLLLKKIADNHSSVRGIKEIPAHIQKIFVSSHDIHWKTHIDCQAAFQRHTDNAVSKTINMTNTVTIQDIKDAYLYAYQKGCKGVTVYRDGCKEVQVLNLGTEKKEEKQIAQKMPKKIEVREIDFTKGASSDYYEIETGYGTLHVSIVYDSEGPCKIFTTIPPIGTELSSLTSALGIFMSKAFQAGYDPQKAIKHLNSAKGDKPVGFGGNRIDSIPHAVAVVLKRHLEKTGKMGDKEQKKLTELNLGIKQEHCPKCYSPNVEYLSGCSSPTCLDCGHSECS